MSLARLDGTRLRDRLVTGWGLYPTVYSSIVDDVGQAGRSVQGQLFFTYSSFLFVCRLWPVAAAWELYS